jgi:hypothetical protein
MSAATSGAGANVIPDIAALIQATFLPARRPKKPKRRADGPPFSKSHPELGARAELNKSTRAEIHFFLAFLAFFALAFFAFFAFFAIVSSQGFHGLNATPRHAWRRASLATSSIMIPADSRADAACRHGGVITLSTAVMRF